MTRWKALPEDLDPLAMQLVVRLRQMKDESGLSLAQLTERTGYSTSSWERYLSGRALAPRRAVEAIVALVGADPVSVLVLLERAREAWPTGVPQEPDSDPTGSPDRDPKDLTAPTPPPRYPTLTQARLLLPPRTVLVAVVSAMVGAIVTLTAVQTGARMSAHAASASAIATPGTTASAVRYSCRFTRTGGKWYAGNATTSSDVVMDGMANAEVAEVQCLLQRAGFSPGGVDGMFGPMTLRALLKEQQIRHLDIDGQVGPQTWAALRR
ncbi:helix-turn-helix protein [Streptomyces sp. 846.5]|nr:helix-turn-helix domain-containing protein [Streptomyces sp. 846.5]TDU02140.1 helix-turn-helix protein [Streptomyces sp. 846.5]